MAYAINRAGHVGSKVMHPLTRLRAQAPGIAGEAVRTGYLLPGHRNSPYRIIDTAITAINPVRYASNTFIGTASRGQLSS